MLLAEKRRIDALHYQMATRIAAAYRGHLDRRAASVERCLKRIRNTSRILLLEALRNRKGVKVFWYKRKEELRLLYRDYRLLVSRLGNDPPLHRVEANIHRLFDNIDRIEGAYATIIQKRVRGIIGRAFMRELRAEKFYLFAKQNAAAFTIQKTVRGWTHRRFSKKLRILHKRDRFVQRFQEEITQQRRKTRGRGLQAQVTRAYVHGRKHEKMARLLGRIPYARPRTSIYRDDAGKLDLEVACRRMVEHDKRIRQEEAARTLARSHRQIMVLSKFQEHPSYATYFNSAGNNVQPKSNKFLDELNKYRRLRNHTYDIRL